MEYRSDILAQAAQEKVMAKDRNLPLPSLRMADFAFGQLAIDEHLRKKILDEGHCTSMLHRADNGRPVTDRLRARADIKVPGGPPLPRRPRPGRRR